MVHMNKLADMLTNQNFGMNADNTKLVQKEARLIKSEAVNAMLTDLTESLNEAVVKMADNKVFIQFDNEHVGMVTLEVDIKLKGLDFELDEVIEQFEAKEAEKAEKEAEKARLKAQKLAEKEAKKAKK